MSVKKNSDANEALIITGWILVTSKNNATGIPPRVVNPFKAPEIAPVNIFDWSLLILLFVYPLINRIEKKIIIKHTDKCVVWGERYFSKYNPIGEPKAIPINNLNTKFQSILFHIYGTIKILIKTSSIKIIGTISIAGNIKEKPEIHVAENPNPLNPLIIDAINTVNNIKKISTIPSWKNSKKFTFYLFFQL